MSSRSSASSTTRTATNTVDARVVADNGAIVVRGGQVNVTDGGAFEFAGDVIDGNFEVLQDTSRDAFRASEGIADIGAEIAFDAFGFARDVTDNNRRILQDAFGFSNDATDRSLDFADDAGRRAENIVQDAFGFADNASNLNKDFFNGALAFVDDNLTKTGGLVTKIVDQQRNESTQLASQLMKLGIPAIALVLIAGALRK